MDNKGTKCTTKGCIGTFEETSVQDDWNGLLHCTVCGKRISRHTSDTLPSMERLYDALCHEDKHNKGKDCKGQFYRYRISEYGGGDLFGRRETFTLLKRKSCPGCEVCEGTIEYLKNYTSEIGGLPPHPHVSDFDIVMPVWIACGYDMDSGQQEYEIEFRKVSE